PSRAQPGRVAQMPPADVDELRVVTRRPDGERVADGPDGETGQPQTQPEPDRAGDGAVGDRHRPGRPAEQYGLGERAMDRREIAGNGLVLLHSDERPAAEREEAEE